jgi:hypothetical protein
MKVRLLSFFLCNAPNLWSTPFSLLQLRSKQLLVLSCFAIIFTCEASICGSRLSPSPLFPL